MPGTIAQLIINGPYDEPASHWRYDRESRTFSQESGRRPAGFVVANGTMLVLEVKGQDSPQNQAKRAALHEWAHAVTEHGGFGKWTWGVSKSPSDLLDVINAVGR